MNLFIFHGSFQWSFHQYTQRWHLSFRIHVWKFQLLFEQIVIDLLACKFCQHNFWKLHTKPRWQSHPLLFGLSSLFHMDHQRWLYSWLSLNRIWPICRNWTKEKSWNYALIQISSLFLEVASAHWWWWYNISEEACWDSTFLKWASVEQRICTFQWASHQSTVCSYRIRICFSRAISPLACTSLLCKMSSKPWWLKNLLFSWRSLLQHQNSHYFDTKFSWIRQYWCSDCFEDANHQSWWQSSCCYF